MEHFERTLAQYGADLDSLRYFDAGDKPELLPYATLVSARQAKEPGLDALVGVYEWQNTALAFLLDADRLTDENAFNLIRRRIAMRGDAQYLGVVRPGHLTIHRVALDGTNPQKNQIKVEGTSSAKKRATFPFLANQRPGISANPRGWISNVILKLLADSIEDLKKKFGVKGEDAISVVGRALFTRFLGDRGLLPPSLAAGGLHNAERLFDNARHAENTSQWLDETFNGDFLYLRPGFFRSLQAEAFWVLGNILRRAPDGQLSLKWEEKWENLDFAHIPVGVLSQAYEHYLLKFAPEKRKKEGGYYTPRIIAETMVRAAFHAIRREKAPHQARVLDPSAGAGVFLITAFRYLVGEHWRATGVRPDTSVLRKILYDQITGFDINESALRFAALGLYLMSIELDSHPEPVQKLRFENLRGTVLHKVGGATDEEVSESLGSLGPDVDRKHLGRYDLVIGNPPWSSATGLPDWRLVKEQVAEIAASRISKAPAPKLPNEVLDLPFVWKAMEWAKPGAQISFALHARLLFQQGEGMSEARSSLFTALDVTGIVNGSELRQTKVWPEISAPFCLLFARNQVPPPGAAFRFVSPRLERPLNSAGALRIDANNAEAVTAQQVTARPEIFKILFRGSPLDLEIYDRLMSQRLERLDRFWTANGDDGTKAPRYAGNGYQRLRKSSAVKKLGDGAPGEPADYLSDLRELTPLAMRKMMVSVRDLVLFTQSRVHRGRPRELFIGPKLLVHKSPPAQSGRIRVSVTDSDLVFNESYYGYNAKEHSDGKRFVRYLAMLASSKVALWHTLITSGEFGFEREVIEKFVIDSIPIPPFEELTPSQLNKVDSLFLAVSREDNEATWKRVDRWASSLYGLNKRDLEVISDTLKYNLPFATNKKIAQMAPSPRQTADFTASLTAELGPWARRYRARISIAQVNLDTEIPWQIVQIIANQNGHHSQIDSNWPAIVRLADHSAATEIMYPDSAQRCLWLARLKQARYWSRTQARLVARRIAWEHLPVLLTGDE